VNDWRIAMTWQRIFQISFELVICVVHPIPGEPYFFWKNDIINAVGSRWVPNDVVFSLPMFLRFYLIARSMHLHKYFTLPIILFPLAFISSLSRIYFKNPYSDTFFGMDKPV
jgi:hypothetical protein